MAKFRYYVTDVMNGMIVGTDDRGVADGYAAMESDAFVVDTETGKWLMAGENDDIEEVDVEEVLPVEPAVHDPDDDMAG